MNLRLRLLARIPATLSCLCVGIAAADAQTASPGLVYPPSTAPNSFFGSVDIKPGVTAIFLGPSSSTVVLNSFSFSNDFAQTNGAAASIRVQFHQSAAAADCATFLINGVGGYEAAAGQTLQIDFPTGLTLKPAAAGQFWCLTGYVQIKGNPGSYVWPTINYAGYVVSGVAPSALAADPRQNSPFPQHTP
jgi:hypothetical protein